jgi:hypothetical protein
MRICSQTVDENETFSSYGSFLLAMTFSEGVYDTYPCGNNQDRLSIKILPALCNRAL